MPSNARPTHTLRALLPGQSAMFPQYRIAKQLSSCIASLQRTSAARYSVQTLPHGLRVTRTDSPIDISDLLGGITP
jgi:hypothetical protein